MMPFLRDTYDGSQGMTPEELQKLRAWASGPSNPPSKSSLPSMAQVLKGAWNAYQSIPSEDDLINAVPGLEYLNRSIMPATHWVGPGHNDFAPNPGSYIGLAARPLTKQMQP